MLHCTEGIAVVEHTPPIYPVSFGLVRHAAASTRLCFHSSFFPSRDEKRRMETRCVFGAWRRAGRGQTVGVWCLSVCARVAGVGWGCGGWSGWWCVGCGVVWGGGGGVGRCWLPRPRAPPPHDPWTTNLREG